MPDRGAVGLDDALDSSKLKAGAIREGSEVGGGGGGCMPDDASMSKAAKRLDADIGSVRGKRTAGGLKRGWGGL